GPTFNTIFLGFFGTSIGLIGIYLSIKTWFKGFKESIEKISYNEPEFIKKEIEPQTGKNILEELKGLKDEISLKKIKNDKDLLTVLAYLIIGEFGIFSSPTISPPTPKIGFLFFIIFLIGAFIFLRRTYKNFKNGIIHLIITIIFGFILSVILGIFWGGLTLKTLLSFNYFKTTSVVALITGISVSLIMGNK
ncbi:MAG: hypothetical protein QXY45_01045, partial [Candidatus Aenigmatarchaeota archaeon]